ncbi:flagellar hook-length control protein FliK [Legionella worsleiensis]|uniref:Putative flagellar hook-length control protein n=2 Tax=Legionella worsleiensis TaxID=45076 RepID=A0A0W1A6K3_9GAMM|nr:putative flagellar hook-length control protein [Legionella worsleiensis]STY33337.1 flagellar hook-length control protein FliK [Legionella worsleiensis]
MDLNNLILNSFKLSEGSGTGQDQTKSLDSLETKASLDDEVNDPSVDPGAFVLLFAQILSNDVTKQDVLPEENLPSNTDLSTEQLNESQVDGINPNLASNVDDLITDDKEALSQGDILTDTDKLSSSQEENLNTNVVLNWIEYDQFSPPLAPSSDLKTLLTGDSKGAELSVLGSDSNRLNQPNINYLNNSSAVNGDEDAAPQLDEDSLSTEQSAPFNTNLKSNFAASKENTLAVDPYANEQSLQSEQSGSNSSQQPNLQPDFTNTHFSNLASVADKVKQLDISLPLTNAQWADKFSEHIVWMGQQGVKSATIKLNPEELGPLEINIKVIKDLASVNITSHTYHARDVVDQALPRLRELMADQGLNLSEVTVGMNDSSRQSEQNEQGFAAAPDESVQQSENEPLVTQIKRQPPKGLIDYFA